MLKLSATEEKYERVIEEKDDEIRKLYKELEDKHRATRKTKGKMSCCSWGRHWLNRANEDNRELKWQVLEMEEVIEKYEREIAELKEELQEQCGLVIDLERTIAEQDETDLFVKDDLDRVTDELNSLNEEIEDLTEELASAYEQINELKDGGNMRL